MPNVRELRVIEIVRTGTIYGGVPRILSQCYGTHDRAYALNVLTAR
jgi:hypothetical protein